jgi:hypothetical protein
MFIFGSVSMYKYTIFVHYCLVNILHVVCGALFVILVKKYFLRYLNKVRQRQWVPNINGMNRALAEAILFQTKVHVLFTLVVAVPFGGNILLLKLFKIILFWWNYPPSIDQNTVDHFCIYIGKNISFVFVSYVFVTLVFVTFRWMVFVLRPRKADFRTWLLTFPVWTLHDIQQLREPRVNNYSKCYCKCIVNAIFN